MWRITPAEIRRVLHLRCAHYCVCIRCAHECVLYYLQERFPDRRCGGNQIAMTMPLTIFHNARVCIRMRKIASVFCACANYVWHVNSAERLVCMCISEDAHQGEVYLLRLLGVSVNDSNSHGRLETRFPPLKYRKELRTRQLTSKSCFLARRAFFLGCLVLLLRAVPRYVCCYYSARGSLSLSTHAMPLIDSSSRLRG